MSIYTIYLHLQNINAIRLNINFIYISPISKGVTNKYKEIKSGQNEIWTCHMF